MVGRFNLLEKLRLFRSEKATIKARLRSSNVRNYTLTNPYHAVSVQPGTTACGSAQGCSGTRFLSAEAPPLPMPGCDAQQCRCRYVHHEDRRSGLRRSADATQMTNHFWRGEERRRDTGRRITDL